MKKASLFIFALLTVLCVLPAAAQEPIPKAGASELYYVNVPVEKVYPYSKGYAVVYRSGVNQLATTYIPIEWFRPSTLKAKLVQLGAGRLKPSMSVFYKDGEFHSVRLYVTRSGSDGTWGTVRADVNIDSRFEGVEKLELAF